MILSEEISCGEYLPGALAHQGARDTGGSDAISFWTRRLEDLERAREMGESLRRAKMEVLEAKERGEDLEQALSTALKQALKEQGLGEQYSRMTRPEHRDSLTISIYHVYI